VAKTTGPNKLAATKYEDQHRERWLGDRYYVHPSSSQDHHSDPTWQTPASPSLIITGILVNAPEDMGAHAVRGTRKTPYAIEQIEIRLKEMAVAMGAPMKPSPKGLGPHTVG